MSEEKPAAGEPFGGGVTNVITGIKKDDNKVILRLRNGVTQLEVSMTAKQCRQFAIELLQYAQVSDDATAAASNPPESKPRIVRVN